MVEKILVRIAFCLVPALVAGATTALLSAEFGALFFVFGFAFGLDITEARPERGEF